MGSLAITRLRIPAMLLGVALFVSALASGDPTIARGTEADSNEAPIHPPLIEQLQAQRLAAAAFRFGPLETPAFDTTRRQRRAVATSEGYATRLKIHQIGAIVMIPLVASEFIIGQSLLNSTDRPRGLITAHKAVALGIGGVFGVNTITGALNWWETRKEPEGRTRRTLHALLLLASDAGFLWAAAAANGANRTEAAAVHHRAIAEASISLSLIGTAMMWLWKS